LRLIFELKINRNNFNAFPKRDVIFNPFGFRCRREYNADIAKSRG